MVEPLRKPPGHPTMKIDDCLSELRSKRCAPHTPTALVNKAAGGKHSCILHRSGCAGAQSMSTFLLAQQALAD
jgi:hypothetical protein